MKALVSWRGQYAATIATGQNIKRQEGQFHIHAPVIAFSLPREPSSATLQRRALLHPDTQGLFPSLEVCLFVVQHRNYNYSKL